MKFLIEKRLTIFCKCGKEFQIATRDEDKVGKMYCPFCGEKQDVIYANATCNKRKLSKAASAKAIVHNFYLRVIKGNKKRQEQRNYYCEICNAWHLTSQEEQA